MSLVRAARVVRSAAQTIPRSRGWMPLSERVRWFGARSPRQAGKALSQRVEGLVSSPAHWVLLVGGQGPLRRALEGELTERGIPYRATNSVDQIAVSESDAAVLACIVAVDIEIGRITASARAALANRTLAEIPFEYAVGLQPEASQMREQDEYANSDFISPVLLADPSPYKLYADSLERFEQKCGLRDYLDLYQLLASVLERGVEGDVAEFGSYQGHSGWLIAKTLEALGSTKAVHLFDTFDVFPTEDAGVDYFWSGTHPVRIQEIREKLGGLDSVRLVPGEFERTVPESAPDRIALAYVDCDSYRAVAYLARAVFEPLLSAGGCMVFEDYGHPALLGCRLAVHEYFDGRTDCVRFFSQFSGLYVVMKLPAAQ